MKQIKFRGKTSEGKFVYGDLIHIAGDAYIKSNKGGWIVDPVDEFSVTQLVGYDSDDKEVYEDDILISKDGWEWTAELSPQAEMFFNGDVCQSLYNEKHAFKLKGSGENELSDF